MTTTLKGKINKKIQILIHRLAEVIKKHKSLTTINLCNNNITDRGASYLLDAIRTTQAPLKELHLTGNK
jgi:Ran GTPase-activating protein (RanGAP) involved in mRNA processing and transport